MKKREAKLRNFKVLNTNCLDIVGLRSLRILDDIPRYFESNGLGFVFEENSGVFENVI